MERPEIWKVRDPDVQVISILCDVAVAFTALISTEDGDRVNRSVAWSPSRPGTHKVSVNLFLLNSTLATFNYHKNIT